jgi:hypothetical protein
MRTPVGIHAAWMLSGLAVALGGCGQGALSEETRAPQAERLHPTWEEFRDSAWFFEQGNVYIANGDETFDSLDELRAYYDAHTQSPELGTQRSPLVQDLREDGQPNRWSETDKKQLTYCVSADVPFYSTVVSNLAAAARQWEQAADVKFIHLAEFDGSCYTLRPEVKFRVLSYAVDDDECGAAAEMIEDPQSPGGTCPRRSQVIASSFFPDDPPQRRAILLNEHFLYGSATQYGAAMGSLIHELGHVLGFRHEHLRVETSPACRKGGEGSDWVGLTDYDPGSVMNYGGVCGGIRNRTRLTPLDRQGARLAYGASTVMSPELLWWLVHSP